MTNLTDKEIFNIAKDTRNFEIEMFWKRTNYFLLLNSAIGVALLATLSRDKLDFELALIIILCFSFIGCFVCLAWIKVVLGSKFWQSHWEQVLVEWQERVGLKDDDDLFSPKHIDKRVRINLKAKECKNIIKKFYNWLILCKPSVSRWMQYTALFFFIIWLSVAIICLMMYNDMLPWLEMKFTN